MSLLPPPKESEIQHSILDYLTLRGHFVYRQNTGMFTGEYKGKKRFIRAGIKGSSDLIGVQKGTGRMIAIEVKRPGQKPTPEQISFLAEISLRGGLALVATSVDDVTSHL